MEWDLECCCIIRILLRENLNWLFKEGKRSHSPRTVKSAGRKAMRKCLLITLNPLSGGPGTASVLWTSRAKFSISPPSSPASLKLSRALDNETAHLWGHSRNAVITKNKENVNIFASGEKTVSKCYECVHKFVNLKHANYLLLVVSKGWEF